MLKVIVLGTALATGLSLSSIVEAQGMALDCAVDAAQCDDACSTERRWKFFKGKKFKQCAARCEDQLSKQCSGRDNSEDRAAADGERADKDHPQDREYGYEKNADRVKGQHGEAVAAQHRQAKDQHEANRHESETAHSAHEDLETELEDDASELEDKAEKAKDKASKSKKGKPGEKTESKRK